MELKEIEYIQECLDIERKHFAYFKDKYALMILAQKLKQFDNNEASVSEIKKSDFGFLLNKAEVKNLTAKLPRNSLNSDLLANHWPSLYFDFELELGSWGAFTSRHRKDTYNQTTRPGYNLVLKLNFSIQHDIPYYNLLKPDCSYGPFAYSSHPISLKRNTLAWARLDIDLDTGELLIEEIQNDWLREARRIYIELMNDAKEGRDPNTHWYFSYDMKSNFKKFEHYYLKVLKPYYDIWDEAVLAATIDFSISELGIKNIYMHEFDTGNKLKDLYFVKPPKSLYTKLPRRFGFKLTANPPKLLANYSYLKKAIRRDKDLAWYNIKF